MCIYCGWERHSERIRVILSRLKDADPVDKPTSARLDSLEKFAKGVLTTVTESAHITPNQRDSIDDMKNQLEEITGSSTDEGEGEDVE